MKKKTYKQFKEDIDRSNMIGDIVSLKHADEKYQIIDVSTYNRSNSLLRKYKFDKVSFAYIKKGQVIFVGRNILNNHEMIIFTNKDIRNDGQHEPIRSV